MMRMMLKPSDLGSSMMWFIEMEDQERLEKAVEVVARNLDLETQLASPDMPGDVLLYAWPKVSLGDEQKGLINPKVSAELVVLAEDVQADLLVIWSIDLSILEKELVIEGEGEKTVIVGIICGGVSGIVLSEEGVPGGVVDLV
ncbi:hypothetical protein C0993_002468 [Termitomyces sp. T159_Od127]|nr:hypothetical protein C0993_002468 [Termitomyces sp. T159_Od127]